jgi:selenide,water dikinase
VPTNKSESSISSTSIQLLLPSSWNSPTLQGLTFYRRWIPVHPLMEAVAPDVWNAALAVVLATSTLTLLWKQRTAGADMSTHPPPIVSDLVLVGGGHTHVHVLKMFGMPKYRGILRQEGIRVTLIAKDLLTPYSGMLPGYVAGHYTYEEIHIDLVRLCRFAGVNLIHSATTAVTYSSGGGGTITCSDGRPPLRFDCLSINIGSSPQQQQQMSVRSGVIPVKPIANFGAFYEKLVEDWQSNKVAADYRLAVVGGGAGGLEMALAVQHRLQTIQPGAQLEIVVVTKGTTIMPSHNKRVRTIFTRILKQRGIRIFYQAEVVAVQDQESAGRQRKHLVLSSNSAQHHPGDILVDDCLWCTTAGCASWLSEQTPFATTTDGFVRVMDTYEAIHHPGVFVAGDCCHMDLHPRPKAGVFAVRAGPYLLHNLVAYLQRLPLRKHTPQKEFLGIISTGDKYGVASKGWWFAMEANWIWAWKDWIDRAFMDKFAILPDVEEMMSKMKMPPKLQRHALAETKGADTLEAFVKDPMRCGGCGAKVGATTVGRVLATVHRRQVVRAAAQGRKAPAPIDHDDAAVTPLSSKHGALVQTIDYFRALVSDPFVFGKIVAVHSLSDVHAMGATAQNALTLAVAPFAADEAVTESNLLQLLSGVSDVLQDEDVAMAGGHTCEGLELACGLSVQGYISNPNKLFRKKGGKVGDKIVMTKPLGTGALFAADMRAMCKGNLVAEALASMTKSNVVASRIAMEAKGVRAATDVTGFGFIGHLLEMLMANEGDKSLKSIGADLFIHDMPFLQGGIEAVQQGILSTLQIQNARNRRAVVNHAQAAAAEPLKYPLLFDPQTAGGLLFFVDSQQCSQFVDTLRAADVDAKVAGELTNFPLTGPEAEAGLATSVCTIGSGEVSSGLRVRIVL